MDGLMVIQRLGGGNFIDELHAALLEVSEEVVTSGRDGTVSVTFKVKPAQKGAPTVIVLEEISKRPPKSDPQGAFFFQVDGLFHQDDPRQVPMDFRVVGGTDVIRETEQQQAQVKEGGA